jgi:YHS domain-containing protein
VVRWILLFILLLIVGRLFWRVVDSIIEAAGGTSRGRRTPTRRPSVRLVRDPVCGTHVAPASALSLAAEGTTHYFCSEKCRAEFQKRR